MAPTKFRPEETVIYGNYGLCKIAEIKEMDPMGTHKDQMYYVLKPVSAPSSTYFVPLANETLSGKIRQAMTKEEVDQLLEAARGKEISWIDDKNTRTAQFSDILHQGIREELLLLIRCIRQKKQELVDVGKKLPSAADNTLRAASDLVDQEFSYALSIPKEEVGSYILTALN